MNETINHQASEQKTGGPRLWNPSASAAWSLLFTLVFGACLHAKNWRALNEPERAKESTVWFWIGVVLVTVSILGSAVMGQPSGGGILFLFLIGWCFGPARRQIKYVKNELNDQYEKRSWRKPLYWACGLWLGTGLFLSVIGGIGCAFTTIDLNNPDTYVGDYELVALIPDPRVGMLLDVPLPENGFRSDRPFEITVQGQTIRMKVDGAMHLDSTRIDAEATPHTTIPSAPYAPEDRQNVTISGPHTIRDGVLTVGEGYSRTEHAIEAEGKRLRIEVDDGTAVWRRLW